ncbi:hypothetical protein WR25_26655 [Diploscapter pachys]|uniref:Exocyst complex component Sec6 n=1 Tax=Diploscapter pachys TaxID=2018661 RepID=A0A2A2KI10_9BILA|nr:hypothetical protein WR25_26655 [Diploscapter pachys]
MDTLRESLSSKNVTSVSELFFVIREALSKLNEDCKQTEGKLQQTIEKDASQLEDLIKLKKDLMEKRNEVVEANEKYRKGVDEVMSVISQDTEMMEKLNRLSKRQQRLTRMKAERDCRNIVASCERSLQSDDFPELRKQFNAAMEHHQFLVENSKDLVKSFSEKMGRLGEEIRQCLEESISKIVHKIHYPFNDMIDVKAFLSELNSLSGHLALYHTVAEYSNQGSGNGVTLSAMFEPIYESFEFHFYGPRKTNDVKHPEWYFTQALNWTQNCLPFFEALFQRVSNILVRYFHLFFLIYDFHGQSSSSLGATVYFYKQMNELVQRKTEWMLEQEQIQDDDVLFSHLIDEALAYEEQRREMGMHIEDANVMSLFCPKDILARWINIENETCIAQIDSFLTSEDKWSPRFRDLDEADNFAVCECAESLIALIQSLHSRSHLLPDKNAQSSFSVLRFILLEDFCKRLSQISRQAASPWSEPFPQVMNSIWYIHSVAMEWDEANELSADSKTSALLPETAKLYRNVWSQMADEIVNSTVLQVVELAKAYRRQNWCLPNSSLETSERALTDAFCPLLAKLSAIYVRASEIISKESLRAIFKRITSAVAKTLIDELFDMSTRYSIEGAKQMQFDMENGLLPTLHSIYTRNGLQSLLVTNDKEMDRLLSSIRLLALPQAIAILLKDEIPRLPEVFIGDKLAEFNASGLKKKQEAVNLLHIRADFEVSSALGKTGITHIQFS